VEFNPNSITQILPQLVVESLAIQPVLYAAKLEIMIADSEKDEAASFVVECENVRSEIAPPYLFIQ
jgi:hypothetical protein